MSAGKQLKSKSILATHDHVLACRAAVLVKQHVVLVKQHGVQFVCGSGVSVKQVTIV